MASSSSSTVRNRNINNRTSTMTSFLEQVQGLTVVHENTLCIQLEKKNHQCQVSELCEALQSEVWDHITCLKLQVGLTYFYRRNEETEVQFLELCRVIAQTLPNLDSLHLGRTEAGWQSLQVCAKMPVQAVELLLENLPALKQDLKFTSLQLYSSNSSTTEEEEEEEEPIAPLEMLLSTMERHQTRLQRFAWIYTDCLHPRMNSLDPLLTTLSKLPCLEKIHLQTPSWASNIVPSSDNNNSNSNGAKSIEQLLIGCPNLTSLCLKGPRLSPDHMQAFLWGKNLKTLHLAFPMTLAQTQRMGQQVADLLSHHSQLQECNLSLRLELSETNTTRSSVVVPLDPPTITTLQEFQDNIAHALQNNTTLQHLEVLYHNHSSPWVKPTCTDAFVQVLAETNTTITHLNLPFCGELETPVAFYQQLNQSGLRTTLLQETKVNQFWNQLFQKGIVGSKLQKNQEHYENQKTGATTEANESKETTKQQQHSLSMLYYFLREKPCMIA